MRYDSAWRMRLDHPFIAAIPALALICGPTLAAAPKNVIVFIGDGMGAEQIKAAGYYFNGQSGQFSFEQFDHHAWMSHNLSSGGLTDSAASATALATGYKVNSDVVSVALADGPDPRSATPSDGRSLPTLLEYFAAQGKRTGIVTNSFITDATPGAFGSHAADRSLTSQIASGYLSGARPNVLFGGGEGGFSTSAAVAAGYQLVTSRSELQMLDPGSASHVAGIFGTGQFAYAYDQSVGSTAFYGTNPYLHEMTSSAIDLLSKDPNGFFLMVENELTDAGGHLPASGASKLERTMFEVREMNSAVQKAVDFLLANPDTLIIVTADHETGGFVTHANNGVGVLPTASSSDTRHNATMVPFYAHGPNAGHVRGHIDNTDLFRVATTTDAAPALGPIERHSFRQGVGGYAGTIDAQLSSDAPNATNQSLTLITVDGDNSSQQVIRFRELFSAGGVPLDAQIIAAKLSIYTGDSSSDGSAREMSLHRLLVSVDENTTYNNAGNAPDNGISLNLAGSADDDYLEQPESVFPAPSRGAVGTFDVTESLNAWLAAMQSGEAIDFGWVIFNSGTDGWRVNSAEVLTPTLRPLLEVSFTTIPEPAMLTAVPIILSVLARRRTTSRRRV